MATRASKAYLNDLTGRYNRMESWLRDAAESSMRSQVLSVSGRKPLRDAKVIELPEDINLISVELKYKQDLVPK